MAKAAVRPALLGPPIIRALSRIDPTLAVSAAPQLPVALSQWVDWNRAVTLAAALDGRPDPPGDAPREEDAPLAEEHASARLRLQDAIETLLQDLSTTPVTPASLQKAVVAMQRSTQASAGRLRGRAREALAQRGNDHARLAGLDAVMEQTLSPREARLLERLPARALARSGEDAGNGWPDGLPQALQMQVRALLLADLDLRFQPVEGLLAALRPY